MWKAIIVILNIIGFILKWINPKRNKQAEKEKVWNEFKGLEEKYRLALATRDIFMAGIIDRDMRRLRQKYRYLNKQ